jgi:hypothetical protein
MPKIAPKHLFSGFDPWHCGLGGQNNYVLLQINRLPYLIGIIFDFNFKRFYCIFYISKHLMITISTCVWHGKCEQGCRT